MSITLVYHDSKRTGARYDPEKGWISYKIDVRVGGKRYRQNFDTRKKAEDFVGALKSKHAYSKAGVRINSRSITVRELFDCRLSLITNEKEVKRATRVFNLFCETIPSRFDIADIRKAHFQQYINERLGVKPETINREVTILSTAFKQAAEIFPIELEHYEPPDIARPRTKKGRKPKHIITEAEKDLIVRSIITQRLPKERRQRSQNRPTVAAMFEIGWLLGLRFTEVRRLRKSDLKAKTLRVVRWKTGTVSLIEFLPDQAVEILSKSSSPTEYIFDLTCSETTFLDMLREACKANGIKYGRGEIDGMTFHNTRHSFTSRLIQVTDMATAAEFTGHSDMQMVAYYSHASTASKKAAMEALYGNGKNLREIYDKVVSGEMDFEAFLAAIK